MEVTLLHYTPLEIADIAIGKCWDKPSPKGTINCARIERVANKNKHASTIEHLSYNFDIDGVSRALLQEDARHRIGSLSVKSTRYTLKELKDANINKEFHKFMVCTDIGLVDKASLDQLKKLQKLLKEGISNDITKYCLPESYKTSYVRTFNARSLQNFLQLRTSKSALWEIQQLAHKLFEVLPEDHKFLFEDYLNKGEENGKN